ncbi:hypothetical protein AB9M62_25325 [Bacillales bacterium AN1005]
MNNPFNKRGFFRIMGFMGVMILTAIINIPILVIVNPIAYIALIIYFKKKHISNAKRRVQQEIKEYSKLSFNAFHAELKWGTLGLTDNYLFFVPNKQKEEPILINASYLSTYDYGNVGSGDYVTIRHDNVSTTRESVDSMFYCAGVTPNGDKFEFSWYTWGLGQGKKFYKYVSNMSNSPDLTQDNIKRKLI